MAATGENPVIVCSRKADVIVGPVGIVIADALLGEITAAMATAVGRSQAKLRHHGKTSEYASLIMHCSHLFLHFCM